MADKLRECPFCGYEDGFYTRCVQTYEQHYNHKGIAEYATDTGSCWGGRIKYCEGCNRKIGTMEH